MMQEVEVLKTIQELICSFFSEEQFTLSKSRQTLPYALKISIINKDLYQNQKREEIIMETVKIKYFTDQIDKLEYIDGKSDWIDLRASENVTLKSGEFALIPLGVAMELPTGYEAHIVPRSSTYKNFGVIQANHCGIVDGSYCGDNDMWRMPVIAMRDTEIHVNDRICQFRIMKNQPQINFDEVEHLTGKDRGGFGSTGKQ